MDDQQGSFERLLEQARLARHTMPAASFDYGTDGWELFEGTLFGAESQEEATILGSPIYSNQSRWIEHSAHRSVEFAKEVPLPQLVSQMMTFAFLGWGPS